MNNNMSNNTFKKYVKKKLLIKSTISKFAPYKN